VAPEELVIVTLLATVDDCSKVAAQVHWDTMVVAVRPTETLPPASKSVSRFSYNKKEEKIHHDIEISMYISGKKYTITIVQGIFVQ